MAMMLKFRSLLAIAVAVAQFSSTCWSSAQAGDGLRSRATLQGPAEQSTSPVVKDALNRPCLDMEAVSRAHAANPSVFDHIVSIKNNCAKRIRVKLCYYNTETCKELLLSPYSREDTILGTMAGGASRFRYSVIQSIAKS